MADYLVRYHEPATGPRVARVALDHPAGAADALGIPAAQVLSVRAAPAERASRRHRFDLRLFAQELAVLLDAGVPLVEALQTLQERESGAAALSEVLVEVRAGEAFSVALSRQPGCFDELFCALVAAGERNGQLGPTLRDHAAYLAWSQQLRDRLLAACQYPVMLLAAGWAVVSFLLLYVLPRFAGVFEGLGRDLPWISQALIGWGRAAQAQPVLAVALALSLPAAAVLLWRSAGARRAVQGMLARNRWIGPRLRLLALARLYRTLALLLGAGVPVLPALRLAQGVLPITLQGALLTASEQVAAGRRLSDALAEQGLGTSAATRMLRVGESSGQVAPMLARAAAFHDDEIARFGDWVSRSASPVLMLVMGVLIGAIVVAMYLPIFTLMEQVQ